MNDLGSSSPRVSRKSPPWMLVGLAGVAIAAYWFSFGGSGTVPGWGTDLDQALAQAQAANQHVVVFFSAPG
jgi:hypothetical protein